MWIDPILFLGTKYDLMNEKGPKLWKTASLNFFLISHGLQEYSSAGKQTTSRSFHFFITITYFTLTKHTQYLTWTSNSFTDTGIDGIIDSFFVIWLGWMGWKWRKPRRLDDRWFPHKQTHSDGCVYEDTPAQDTCNFLEHSGESTRTSRCLPDWQQEMSNDKSRAFQFWNVVLCRFRKERLKYLKSKRKKMCEVCRHNGIGRLHPRVCWLHTCV